MKTPSRPNKGPSSAIGPTRPSPIATIAIALIELAILLPWALDLRPDDQVQALLTSPTIEQQFASAQTMAIPTEDQSSLIHQAQIFARLINPPVA
ncbi:MAG: hypothetical protein QHH07_11840, partial [Sedimentisphaerales bacterium]|nr:hypothetical protein [Sedimentisphaerales bacterium]